MKLKEGRKKEPMRALGDDYLDDDFELSDTKEGKFRQVITEMSESTFCEVVYPGNFLIYSLLGPRNEGSFRVAIIDPDYADFRMLTPKNPQQCYFRRENHTMGTMSIASLKNMGITDKQINEIEESGFFLQYRREKSTLTLIPSKPFLATLCRQLGTGKLKEGRDVIRNIYLASLMQDADEFSLVYRKAEAGYAKAFGCFSPKFAHNPQTMAFVFMDKLSALDTLKGGHLSVRQWRVNHSITTIDFILHELEEIIGGVKITPGVRLVMSDIGDASYSLQNTLSLNGGIVLLDEHVSRNHTGTLEIDNMVENYEKHQFSKIQKNLTELKALKEFPVESKRKALCALLMKLKFSYAFGIKNATEFKEKYLPKKNEPCTAQEVALAILEIPGIIHSSSKLFLVQNVSNCVGQLFNLDIGEELKR